MHAVEKWIFHVTCRLHFTMKHFHNYRKINLLKKRKAISNAFGMIYKFGFFFYKSYNIIVVKLT